MYITETLIHLNPQDAENNEEGTADDHNVSDWFKGRHQSFNHQLEPWSSADHPKVQREHKTDCNQKQGKRYLLKIFFNLQCKSD